jgi:hypothetical protein
VAIAHIPIGTDRGYAERQHARGVRAVDQNICARFMTQRGEFTNREDNG